MRLTLTRLLAAFTAVLFSTVIIAQPNGNRLPADTARRPAGSGAVTTGPRPYKDVITTKAVSDAGLFNVHKVDEKYYFEIPDSLMGRDILVVNRISKSAAGNRIGGFLGYGGDQIGQNVIRFEKGPNNKIFIRNISFAEYAKDSTSPMFMALSNSNIQPIAAAFDIRSLGKDSTGAVIDITDYISGDNDILHFPAALKSTLRVGALQNDKSYVVSVKSYPINIEVKTLKTYSRAPAAPAIGGLPGAGPSGGNLTFELNSSIVLLPKTPMHQRRFDNRIGYLTVGYVDFDEHPQSVENIVIAKRWRLEPKEEDVQKYLRGELVEPKKPIIFYIDPATPKKWVQYLIDGVNDWQQAFEKAGFKNAIFGKLAPTKQEDSTWSLDDARNSAIVYKASDVPNASGPSISDPRSGEIMESHINWYHNVMRLVRNWYFIQAGAVDKRANKLIFDDELMGRLIRFVSSHEVGHTLGLRHNFGSSSTVPVENLRNKEWVAKNGHTPSIMDYARFNYVCQPEDGLSGEELQGRIGDYDRWAIEWGYRWFPKFQNDDAEKAHLNKWVIEKLKDRRLWWGDGESNGDDPRNQTEDLSDDAVKASTYGITNLKRILPNLTKWAREDNEGFASLSEMYSELRGQFSRYMGHVGRHVGGIQLTPKTAEQEGPVYEFTPEAKQREAVDFISKQLFTTPLWLINNDIFSRTGLKPLSVIGDIQDNSLRRFLNTGTLTKLIDQEASIGDKAYTVSELLADLKKGVWSEVSARRPIDMFRRNLQKSYVNILDGLLNPSSPTGGGTIIVFGGGAGVSIDKSDIKSILRAHLTSLRSEARAAATVIPDNMTKLHLQDIAVRIDNILDPKN
jgi:hypothetical protein